MTSSALLVASCGSPTKSTDVPPPPPPTPDPPKIACPAAETVQSATGNPTTVVYGNATAINGQSPVTTACTPESGSQFPVGQSTVTCTATDALQRADTCTFSVTVLPPPRLTATSFLAFGDSITWGEDGTSGPVRSSVGPLRFGPAVQLPISQTYPGVLQQSLAGRYRLQTPTVTNAGNPGEAVVDQTTFPRFTALTSSRRYEVVLIMEGANDLANRDASIESSTIAGLQQMIRDAKSRGIRPYLATIPPENPAGSRGLAWSLVPAFNDRVRALAAAEGVTLADVFQAFGNDLATYIGIDGLHPTPAGYAKIAEVFFTAIKQTLETPPPTAITTSAARPGRISSSATPAVTGRGSRPAAPPRR